MKEQAPEAVEEVVRMFAEELYRLARPIIEWSKTEPIASLIALNTRHVVNGPLAPEAFRQLVSEWDPDEGIELLDARLTEAYPSGEWYVWKAARVQELRAVEPDYELDPHDRRSSEAFSKINFEGVRPHVAPTSNGGIYMSWDIPGLSESEHVIIELHPDGQVEGIYVSDDARGMFGG